jgi:hypothetical protein
MTSADKILGVAVKQQVNNVPLALDFRCLVSCQAILVSRSGSQFDSGPVSRQQPLMGKSRFGCCKMYRGSTMQVQAPLARMRQGFSNVLRHFLFDQQRQELVVICTSSSKHHRFLFASASQVPKKCFKPLFFRRGRPHLRIANY